MSNINNRHLPPRSQNDFIDYFRRPVQVVRGRSLDGMTVNLPATVKQPPPPAKVKALTLPLRPYSAVQPSRANRPASTLGRLKLTKLKFAPASIMAMAVLIFAGGGAVLVGTVRTNRHIVSQVSALKQSDNVLGASTANTDSDPPPDETAPSDRAIVSYLVAPDLPRIIRIKSLGIEARIGQVGLTKSGALGTPTNIYDTAWYKASAKPGAAGAVLIDGHVHGPTLEGVFYKLKTIKIDDVIEVERGDGQIFQYKVVNKQTYDVDKIDMAAALVSAETGKNGLNLITCTGKINGVEYLQRLIVFAVQQ